MSKGEARRIALTAQGLGARPARRAGSAQLLRLVDRLHAVQIDPINVLVRAHYLPAFSRLGPYSTSAFDKLVDGTRFFEAMVHDASIAPVRMWPLLQWRMEANRNEMHARGFTPEFLDELVAQIAQRGPLAVSDLAVSGKTRREAPTPGAASTWRVNPTASGLRRLWMAGRLVIAGRRGIDRLFDIPERVLPAEVLAAPAVEVDDARRALLLMASRALGVATATDLADYFRLGLSVSGWAERRQRVGRPVVELLRDLVDAGELLECSVEGWRQPVYLDPKAKSGPAIERRSLVSPFDSLLWGRDRVERLFGFRYKIEIYTPQAKREYGYYVLPFLLGENLVARVDLKADRVNRELLVQGSFAEAGARPGEVATALAGELEDMASWLGLERVRVRANGDLAKPLTRALRAHGLPG